jgi:acetyl-CoA acetyltransferase
MCSPIGDGSAAVIVTTPEIADAWGGGGAVTLLATAVGASRPDVSGRLVPEVARRAFEWAGLGPADVDVVECHDATSPAELIVLEELGLAGPGEAVGMVRRDETRIGGRLPVNPSGGLESKGHPIAASGLAQIVELADQLRGRCGPRQVEGARIALAENAGGYMGPDAAVATVTILGARP